MSAASENLRNHQEQENMDGSIVKVSRQAVEETLSEYAAILGELKVTTALLVDMHIATNGDDGPTELRDVYPSVWKTIDRARAAIARATHA